ncbi:hypothetical protein [Embleya sp. NBC_00896]|uniref:hypothetical protein n=1 Tax=Embleya sp. NBC_00896 TaxID=2975961 RepID=UPI0038702199|nr:hypothetical protein OG928_00865 [Embleya sp. NBC_00896]
MLRKIATTVGAAAAAVALLSQPAQAGQGANWFDVWGGGGNGYGHIAINGTAVGAQNVYVKDTDCNSQWTSLQIYMEGYGTKTYTTAGYGCNSTIGPFNGPIGTLPNSSGEVLVRMCSQTGQCGPWKRVNP